MTNSEQLTQQEVICVEEKLGIHKVSLCESLSTICSLFWWTVRGVYVFIFYPLSNFVLPHQNTFHLVVCEDLLQCLAVKCLWSHRTVFVTKWKQEYFMEIRSRKILRGWALLVTGKAYMVWRGKKKVTHTSFMSLSKTNDDVPEWTFPAQICEWGKFGFSSCSWLLGQTIWRTYDSLLLFLRCYPWQQVGEENIHHRLSLKQPSQGADWSSWRKKCFWPTSPVKCTPITQWKQEEEQMEGLPLPHTSKCNLYLFPFLILTPSPVGCCLATLPPCSTAALHFFSPPLSPHGCTGVGKRHDRMCSQQSAGRDIASSSAL